jgi:glycyl-tRNA synthetase beta chain
VPNLLFELGTEELPAAYVPPAIDHLHKATVAALKEHGLAFGEVTATGTPRRLVLFMADLPVAQAARTEEIPGPPEKAAYKDGQPTRAAIGFAEKNGVKVEDLVVKETPKGRYLYAVKRVEGRHATELLAELLPAIVRGIPFPKSMRWPQAPGFAFGRPIRRVTCLFGRDLVPIEIAGVAAGRVTLGHPFLAEPRELPLERADYGAYRTLLKSHAVIVDRNERRSAIQRGLEAVFERYQAPFGAYELLEEVTDLVEAPEVMEGGFDEKYLKLPREVIEAAMTDHQRYFPIVGADGKIRPRFAFVANRPKEHAALIREGNERVLRARLEDSEFYLREDLKRSLRVRAGALGGIVFQEKLGTMREKTERLGALVDGIARVLALSPEHAAAARTAAELAKADLTTELVKEFPQLQGAVGAQYAALQGEGEAVARAIQEQYMPRFAGDELPKTPAGLALSLAEKLDNLAGFFAIGLAPSGSADPYQLRRQAAGVVRIVLERGLAISLREATRLAALPYERHMAIEPLRAAVTGFIQDRAKNALLEQGFRYDLVDAAMGAGADDLVDLKRRLEALAVLAKEPGFADLVELVERTWNISKALDDPKAGLGGPRPVEPRLLTEEPEKALATAFQAVRTEIEEKVRAHDYLGAARLYREALAAPVHAFFEKVFVNVEDPAVRGNRLSLLREINRLFAASVADLAKVVEGKK